MSSLHEVVRYFQEKTGYTLPPYSPSELYDTWIGQSPTLPFHQQPPPSLVSQPSLSCGASDVQAASTPDPEAGDSAYMDPDSCSTDDVKLVGAGVWTGTASALVCVTESKRLVRFVLLQLS